MTQTVRSPLDDLRDVISLLWPGMSDTWSDDPLGESTIRFVVLPSLRHPRVVVSANRRAAARSLLRFSSSSKAGDVLIRWAGSLALRLPGATRLGGSLTYASRGESSITDFLAGLLGRPLTMSLTIGTDRANRKPVLTLFAPDGSIIAFAKIGHTSESAVHVELEARNLNRIQGVDVANVEVPRVLSLEYWSDMPVLVLSPLVLTSWQALRQRGDLLGAAEGVASVFGTEGCHLGDTRLWQEASIHAESIEDTGVRDEMQAILDSVVERHGATLVRSGAWHGDFAPWNMAWRRDTLMLWDWERLETGVPVGMDLIHHSVQVATSRHGFTVEAVLRGMETAVTVNDAATALALKHSYLLAISTRYFLSSQRPGGSVLRPRALVCLDAWRQFAEN